MTSRNMRWLLALLLCAMLSPGLSAALAHGEITTWAQLQSALNAGGTVTLPEDLTAIEEGAFEGIAATVVEIPAGCGSVGDYAFRDCAGLTMIRIPADCALGTDVFDGCAKVYVFGATGSPAEAYCQSHGNCVFVEDAQN